MKRHVQEPGIRRWTGEDFIELQGEPMVVLDNFFAQYGSCVIRGCEVVGKTITSGIVALAGIDELGKSTFRVVRFNGAQNINNFPVYLALQNTTVNRVYEDGKTRPIAYKSEAVLVSSMPTSPYLRIDSEGGRLYIDAIQDEEHRLITDTERSTWNDKATKQYVDGKVAAMINSAPATLDTLKELAAALGDDPNFATTIAGQIGKKVDKVEGKQLSTNDYTATDKNRLAAIYEAINGITPVGTVQAFAGTTIPQGWKLCDGATLNKADYADLYAVIGNVFGYSSTTFNIPDLRGEFIRGFSGQRYIDQGRTFGSTQCDALQNIFGTVNYGLGDRVSVSGAFAYSGGNTMNAYTGGGVPMLGVNFDASRVARTSTETRPHNVALNYIIKVQKTLTI